jgi:hypothetical protein
LELGSIEEGKHHLEETFSATLEGQWRSSEIWPNMLCVSTFLNLLYSFHFLNEDEKSSEKPKTKNGEPLGLVPNMSLHLSRILPSNASLFSQNLFKTERSNR